MWKRKRKAEWLPWYRARNYDGNLTEPEKRQLDAFRMQPKHPAAQLDDLPEEVRDYIGKIELELYDKKQDGAAGQALALSAIGAALLFLTYWGCFGAPTIWQYAGAVLVLVFPWFVYWYEWNKNAEEFSSYRSNRPCSLSDEGIRQEWEFNYLFRQAKRDASSKDD